MEINRFSIIFNVLQPLKWSVYAVQPRNPHYRPSEALWYILCHGQFSLSVVRFWYNSTQFSWIFRVRIIQSVLDNKISILKPMLKSVFDPACTLHLVSLCQFCVLAGAEALQCCQSEAALQHLVVEKRNFYTSLLCTIYIQAEY